MDASGSTVGVNYTGGNGIAYSGWTVASTGVTGLNLLLNPGTLANGSGTFTLSLSGTPLTSGAALFPISIGGQSCTLSVTVASTPVSSGPLTFTPCGASGASGPTQAQCDQAYGAGVVTVTSGIQEWVVPVTATYTITAYGAQGGQSNLTSTAGGLGAMVQANFALTQGAVLRLLTAPAE